MAEVFAGIGCVAKGFHQSGAFEPIVLSDIDQWAKANFVANDRTDAKYIRRDISDLRPSDLLKAADGREIAGLLGCPPCQGFSSAGRRNPRDRRNRLLRHYFRLASAFQPPFLLMENVPRVFEYGLFQDLLADLSERYRIWKGVLNAALYGVPQTRQRAIVIAYRRDLGVEPSAPPPTHLGSGRLFEYATRRFLSPSSPNGKRLLGLYPDVLRIERRDADDDHAIARPLSKLPNIITVEEAIGDLPSAERHNAPLPYANGGSRYARSLRDGAIWNHQPWRHRPETVLRLSAIPEGGDPSDLRNCRWVKPNYFSQAYSRLHRRGLARTITTNFHNPGSGRFLHYTDTRTLTVREAARLQGIEDAFIFEGDLSVQEALIGNAFPVPLAHALASHIAGELEKVL